MKLTVGAAGRVGLWGMEADWFRLLDRLFGRGLSAKRPGAINSPRMARVHDDNPDPAGRGERRAIRRAPASGDVVGGRGRRVEDHDDGPLEQDLERFGGETRTCPECKKEVYDDTAVCYHCGWAFEGDAADGPSKPKKSVIIIVGVLIAAFLFWLLRGLI